MNSPLKEAGAMRFGLFQKADGARVYSLYGTSVLCYTKRMKGESMNITIWSDFVCPFCFIGQAHLSKALEGFAGADEVQIEYRSFILSPEAKYVPGEDYYQAFAQMKGGSVAQAREALQRVTRMGRQAGLDINYDLAKNANTYDAHRVMQYAREQGKDGAFFNRVYRAYFSEGEVISDHPTLLRLAREAGLEEAKVRDILASDAFGEQVEQDLARSRAVGVSAVPFFVFEDKYVMSGAQPPESIRQALEKVWDERTA